MQVQRVFFKTCLVSAVLENTEVTELMVQEMVWKLCLY